MQQHSHCTLTLPNPTGRDEVRVGRKPADIRSQEKKWHVIQEQFAAFAAAKAPNLFLKGTKCTSDRCPLEKRNFPPGQHGKDRKAKIVGYGLQLHEKQKAKRMYFTLEGQFREYYEKANRAQGVTGELLIQQLERRLDNVAFRLGFAISRRQARQVVRHGHVTVNGRKVNIPSYQVNVGRRDRDSRRRKEAGDCRAGFAICGAEPGAELARSEL